MKSNIFLFIAIAFLAIACDTIEGDYIEDPDNLQSTVTLFEYTGIGCVNCPEKGHEVVADYMETFGDKLQVVSIHGNEFGTPIDGFFLRTAEGQELAELVEVNGLPKGTVNTLGAGKAEVPSALSAEITKYGYRIPDLELNVDFSMTESTANVTVSGSFRSQLTQAYGPLNIAIYLVQSEIEGPQKDTRGDHEDYHHKHALRKAFTAMNGDLLVRNPQGGMVVEEVEFSMELTEANLVFADGQTINDLHIEPVVFVLNANSERELIPCLINYN